MPTGKRFPEKTILEVLKKAQNGQTVEELSSEYGFSPASFTKWKYKYRTRKKPKKVQEDPNKSEVSKLRKELERWKEMYLSVSIELHKINSKL